MVHSGCSRVQVALMESLLLFQAQLCLSKELCVMGCVLLCIEEKAESWLGLEVARSSWVLLRAGEAPVVVL